MKPSHICYICRIAAIVVGMLPLIGGAQDAEADRILRSRGEIDTAVTIIDGLMETSHWPSNDILIGKIVNFHWIGEPVKAVRNGVPAMRSREGKIRLMIKGERVDTVLQSTTEIPFQVSGRMPCEERGPRDDVNLRSWQVVVKDDAFLPERSLIFRYLKAEEPSASFKEIRAIPETWGNFIASALQWRKLKRNLFVGDSLSDEEVKELKTALLQSNEVVRCQAFARLAKMGKLEQQTFQAALDHSQSSTEVAIKICLVVEKQPGLIDELTTKISANATCRDATEGVALGAYVNARLSGGKIYKTFMSIGTLVSEGKIEIGHFDQIQDPELREVLQLPSVRALIAVSKWLEANKNKDGVGGIEIILRTLHIQ